MFPVYGRDRVIISVIACLILHRNLHSSTSSKWRRRKRRERKKTKTKNTTCRCARVTQNRDAISANPVRGQTWAATGRRYIELRASVTGWSWQWREPHGPCHPSRVTRAVTDRERGARALRHTNTLAVQKGDTTPASTETDNKLQPRTLGREQELRLENSTCFQKKKKKNEKKKRKKKKKEKKNQVKIKGKRRL